MKRSFYSLVIFYNIFYEINAYCDQSIRRVYNYDMESIFGMWYAVGYAQHTPDLTDKPPIIGCIILHIDDVTEKLKEDWMDWSIMRRNWSMPHWTKALHHNHENDLWVNMKGRDESKEKYLRLIWVEDEYSLEQTYEYSIHTPVLWTTEWHKDDELYPDMDVKRFEVIRILKATPTLLVLHHCLDGGDGRVFSLVLRRSPAKLSRWDWHTMRKLFSDYELPRAFRETAVCSAPKVVMSAFSFVVYSLYFVIYLY